MVVKTTVAHTGLQGAPSACNSSVAFVGGKSGGSRQTLRVKTRGCNPPPLVVGAARMRFYNSEECSKILLINPSWDKHHPLLRLRLSPSCFNFASLLYFGKNEKPHPSNLSGICTLKRKNSDRLFTAGNDEAGPPTWCPCLPAAFT